MPSEPKQEQATGRIAWRAWDIQFTVALGTRDWNAESLAEEMRVRTLAAAKLAGL